MSGFYKQLRVGRGGTDFYVYKFRSMRIGADKQGLITVGGQDPQDYSGRIFYSQI